MKKLPVGLQSFANIRENDFLYVDKTSLIYQLLQQKYYFLSRPRRFGKSLLVSTLKELFEGRKELFEGLYIYDKVQWKKYPVILIEFNRLNYKDKTLSESLTIDLDRIATFYNVELLKNTPSEKFEELIHKLSVTEKVVVLIDEYDKPIIDYLDDIEHAKQNRETLKSFYSIIKPADDYLQFMLVTGVSKFSHVSIFSDLNHLTDITIGDNFAAIAGITEDEVDLYFGEYMEALQKKFSSIIPDVRQHLRNEYLGYSWNGNSMVYNPFTLLSIFANLQFGDHWFATGTPTFLMKLIKQYNYTALELENNTLMISAFEKYDIENIELVPLLFQTGYLTIKSLNVIRQTVKLGYPNKEVARAFSIHLLANLNGGKVTNTNALLMQMTETLENDNMEKFLELFAILLKGIAYPIVEVQESYFHSIFYLVVRLLGFYIDCEIITIDGRIDAVIKTQKTIFVIEFKTGNTKKAIQQIREKQYHTKYADDKRPKILVGIDFDIASKKMTDYLIENA